MLIDSALAVWVILGLAAWPGATAWAASDAEITDAHAEVREGVLYLDVRMNITLDQEMIEAMRNAIPIHLTLSARIEAPRDWLYPRVIVSDDRRFRLEYHALSKTWLLTDDLEHEARSFSTLQGALRSLERIRAWPVASARRIETPDRLIGRVRLTLDIDKLPLPLRFPALFDSRWALNSPWFLWSVPHGAKDAP
ncbi:DUF4390 domain-containing protein [Halothiobacillus sp. DCM-1]|uniref:DUF4390 domain-containing protein n=1 Tax=Halothiobacillus sp. DCM-1 TaxID=3112558 RepID=UPI00324AC0CD